jgi:hypothetical protein
MSKALSLVVVLAAACGGADTPAPQTGTTAKATGDDVHGVCVQAFQRQRECTDEYLPALVAARVRKDAPPGIAAEDAQLGRDALVARAREEWQADSTDAAIEETCTQLASTMPSEHQQQMLDHGRQCLATDTCSAFVDCVMPMVEGMLH